MKSERQSPQRKLAAILFADIIGFTRLMQEGETNALKIINRFQEVMETKVSSHHGEIIKTYGDGALVIFDSTVDAVECALEMQLLFQVDPIVPLRIGVHVGELIRKDDDVFGNGVNLASRIESMGVAGSVLLSGDVRAKIKNQESLETILLGQFDFKNVEESIDLYALQNKGLIVPTAIQMQGKLQKLAPRTNKLKRLVAVPVIALLILLVYFSTTRFRRGDVPELPKIALLNFKNEGNASDAFITSGIVAEIRKKLAGLKQIITIPENSLAEFDNSALSLEEIGKKLNAHYIVDGSIQWGNDGSQVQVKTRIYDVQNKKELTSNNFQDDIKDAATLESEITFGIVRALQLSLSQEEKRSLETPPTNNVIAYEAYLAGLEAMPPSHGSIENYEKALSFFKQATLLDSNFAKAWVYLGTAHRAFHLFGYDTKQSRLDSFLLYISRAEEIDPNLYEAALSRARYKKYIHDYDGSRQLFSELLEKRPNDPQVMFETAFTWQREGMVEKALEIMLKVRDIDPNNLEIQLETSWSAIIMGDFDLALECRKRALEIDPDDEWGYMVGAFIYWVRGREGDLEKAGKLLESVPDFQSSYPVFFWVTQFLYEKNYEKALNILKNYSHTAIEKQDSYTPKTLLMGLIYEQLGEENEAKKNYKASLDHINEKVAENPNDHKYRIARGLTYAGLRENTLAKIDADKATELMPSEADYMLNMDAMYGKMQVYAAIGEVDEALDIMAKITSSPTQYRGFMFTKHPFFIELQKNPRFADLMKRLNDDYNPVLN